MARKTAKDYRKEYQDLLDETKTLESRIKKRALDLCKKFPDVDVNSELQADEFLNGHYSNPDYFTSINGYLYTIEAIEKHIASLHPHQQTEIEFVPDNIPVGVRATYDAKNGVQIREPELPDFIEYEDNGDNYEPPERTDESQVLEIRLYCMHGDFTCNKYIKGYEGYNGAFTAETGQHCDLRNQGFMCEEHRDENKQF